MYLYHLTLAKPSGIQCAVYGNFSAPKAQEIIVSRGKVLELLRPDENAKMQVICSTEVFGMIRQLAAFRLTGASQDYIIIASDSGRIVIVEYQKEKNAFRKIHQETFGKSGCRRIVPGQYIAVDPKGRACMIGAIEKQKMVYVLNRDAAANLTISSPLEAHKSHNLVFSMTGLDMGFDNPVFAAIELDYSEADQDSTGEAASNAQKHLTYYELDLGLNHVVRKWSEPVDNGANMLIPVPGGADGPGGVLVCAENFVIYNHQDHREVRAVIPRRTNLGPDRGVLIVASAMHKSKAMYFFLLQSEYGDIYKVTLDADTETVREVKIKYFDTIPTCSSLCVLKTGFLFAASEVSNHGLYQFQSLGDDDDAVESSSASLMETDEGYTPVFFQPHELRNLQIVDDIASLAPIIDLKAVNLLNEEIGQLYSLCGAGPRSTLRVLRPGLSVNQMAVSPLPGNPTAVWTIRRTSEDDFDAYIIVSFTNATLVLSIGETVEEVSDSGFLGTSPTLRVQLLADNSMLQVHPGGLRHIRSDRRINEWRAPGRRTIQRATTNERQVIIALSGGEIIYFEMTITGQLIESEKRDLGHEIAALDVGPVPEGRQRSRFLAVAGYGEPVRILSLDPEDTLQALSSVAVADQAESLLLLDSPAMAAGKEEGAGAGALFLHIGLSKGVLVRVEVDRITGKLADTRQRFLGTKSPKLFAVTIRRQRSMLALTTRPWVGYNDMGRYNLSPLSYESLDYACSFSSEQCPEGFCAVTRNTLRILTLDRLGETFNQQTVRLRYTPRKMVVHPDFKSVCVIEADHAGVPMAARDEEEPFIPQNGTDANGDLQGIEFDEERAALEEQIGAPKGPPGQWASCVRLIDPKSLQTTSVIDLDNNEAAISVACVRFGQEADTLLAVGTVQHLKFYPREAHEGYIRLYKLEDNGRRLELVHRTPVGGIPGALQAFKGRLLAGCGPVLRIYDKGKKKLLRKCEHRKLPVHIASIETFGDRIFVADSQESVHCFKYKKQENVLYEFADDIAPRYISATLPLDYNSMAIGDKFSNFCITRLPTEISIKVEEDPTGGKLAGMGSALNGAPNKLEDVINFHVGDIITSLQQCALQPGGTDVILYSTLMGGIGVFMPFSLRDDVDFLSHVEMHMRQEHPPLAGRDHLAYRGSYFPVKDVIDGDLCEQFSQLAPDKQRAIAAELDRTPGEVLKKLEDIRFRVI